MKKVQYAAAIGALFWMLGAIQNASAANLLFSDGFESGDFSAWDWYAFSIVQSSVKNTGTYALEFYPGYSPQGNTLTTFADQKRVYLSHYRRFAPEYDFHQEGGRHLFRLKSSENGSLDINISSSMQFVVFGGCDGQGGCSEQWFQYASFGLTGGRWYHIEVDIAWNTSGQSDGFIKVYLDGVLKINVTGQQFSSNDEYWDELWITSNDGNCSGGASACTYWVDDVQIWDSHPGTVGIATPPAGSTSPNIESASLSVTGTSINFFAQNPGHVSIGIFNSLGILVARQCDQFIAGGTAHTVSWNRSDSDGKPLVPGLYVVRFESENNVRESRVAFVQ